MRRPGRNRGRPASLRRSVRAGVDQELLVVYSLRALLGLIFHWIESGFIHPPAYMQEQLVKILNQHSVRPKMEIKIRT